MRCGSCGGQSDDHAQLCVYCGASLSSTCAASEGGVTSKVPRRLRTMAVGDILDETIRLFRHNFRTFVGIVAVLQVPLILLQMIQLTIIGPTVYGVPGLAGGGQPRVGVFIFWAASSLALGLLGALAFVVIQAALSTAISERYLDRPIAVGRSYHGALTSFWRTLGMFLLVGTILILLSVTLIGIPFAVYLGVRWSLAVPSIVLEGKGVLPALSRSSSLVKGSWWRVLGVFIIGAIAQYLVAAIPAGILGALIGGVGALISPNAFLVSNVLMSAIGGVFGIVAAPLAPTISVLLYYDLRIRKEGFDLQVLADRLSQGQLSAAKDHF